MKTYGAGASGGQTLRCPGVLLALLLLYLLLLLLFPTPQLPSTLVAALPGVGSGTLGKYPNW